MQVRGLSRRMRAVGSYVITTVLISPLVELLFCVPINVLLDLYFESLSLSLSILSFSLSQTICPPPLFIISRGFLNVSVS